MGHREGPLAVKSKRQSYALDGVESRKGRLNATQIRAFFPGLPATTTAATGSVKFPAPPPTSPAPITLEQQKLATALQIDKADLDHLLTYFDREEVVVVEK